jgi:anti-sigma-K factor RskA
MNMKHTQLTDDLQEQASLYAAGAMPETERLEYMRHLEEDQCSVCQAEVKELQSAISLLAFAVPTSSPSPRVKARLMEQARNASPMPEQRRRAFWWMEWVTAAVAVASMAVAVVVIRTNGELRNEADALKTRVVQLENQVTEQTQNVAFLLGADRIVNLAGQNSNAQASGRVYINDRQWLVSVRDLPPAPAGKTYQLWFVPKSGNPVSAKVFDTASNGSSEIAVRVPDDMGELKAAAVTTEPAGGVPQPTGQFALVGAM